MPNPPRTDCLSRCHRGPRQIPAAAKSLFNVGLLKNGSPNVDLRISHVAQRRKPSMHFGRHREHFITQPIIQCEVAQDPPVVLRITAEQRLADAALALSARQLHPIDQRIVGQKILNARIHKAPILGEAHEVVRLHPFEGKAKFEGVVAVGQERHRHKTERSSSRSRSWESRPRRHRNWTSGYDQERRRPAGNRSERSITRERVNGIGRV